MWYATRFNLNDKAAGASNGIFRLWNIPMLYLPYVTVPIRSDERQIGFLIPEIWTSSTRGLVLRVPLESWCSPYTKPGMYLT